MTRRRGGVVDEGGGGDCAACADDVANCAFGSEPVRLVTGRWGDLNADDATNSSDIALASDKVKPIPDAFTKPRIMLIPGVLNILRTVNVTELQNVIDAVKSLPMTGAISGPEVCPND